MRTARDRSRPLATARDRSRPDLRAVVQIGKLYFWSSFFIGEKKSWSGFWLVWGAHGWPATNFFYSLLRLATARDHSRPLATSAYPHWGHGGGLRGGLPFFTKLKLSVVCRGAVCGAIAFAAAKNVPGHAAQWGYPAACPTYATTKCSLWWAAGSQGAHIGWTPPASIRTAAPARTPTPAQTNGGRMPAPPPTQVRDLVRAKAQNEGRGLVSGLTRVVE